MNRKLRNIIRWLTPYGIVSSYVDKNYHKRFNFIESFKQYVATDKRCVFTQENPYETIVSVQGFGYSGSGAVVDLLREYESIHVIGYVDNEGSATSRDIKCDEVDVLRLAGGLFEIEKYLGSNNIYQNDALLHRVVAQFENSDLYKNNLELRPYYFEFVRQICEILTDSPAGQDYNPYLNHHGNNDILFLKDLSIEAYRDLSRRFLNSIFSAIHQSTGSKPILVLDQITNDWEFDMERYKAFIPNLKIIMVYRDPRDVYAFAKLANIGWIPHKSVDVFIRWYIILLKHFDIAERDRYHVVQFESLVCDYNRVVPAIEQYIGVSPSSHTKKATCLDVSRSKANLSIWRRYPMWKDECEKIQKQLEILLFAD